MNRTRSRLAALALTLVVTLGAASGLRSLQGAPSGTNAIATVGRVSATGPGAQVVHTLPLSNTGETAVEFDLRVVDAGDWPVELPDTIYVDAGAATTVTIAVDVPLRAPDRATDVTTVALGGDGAPVVRLVAWTGGTFDMTRTLGCRFDVVPDGAIDAGDVGLVRDRFGARRGDERYAPALDFDHDGRIGAADVQAVAGRSGAACASTDVYDSAVLREAVTATNIREHLEGLQAIADANGNTRAVQTPGYELSVDFVVRTLAETGWDVTTPEFQYERRVEVSPGFAERIAPDPLVFPSAEVVAFTNSGSGHVTATLQAVDVVVPPSAAPNGNTSGCEPTDFAGFQAGRIALLQRGTCPFQAKVLNAMTAGAVGILIFNEGQTDRTAAYRTSVGPLVGVPVIMLSYALGQALVDQLAGGADVTVHMAADWQATTITHHNVIAEWPHGDPDRVVMVGAHLDSVPAGPGINDNGTGSATLLELARQVSIADVRPPNRLRLAWWGAEEIGLVGSRAWVAQQAAAERDRIILYLNFDMLGSSNWIRGVYDGNASLSSNAAYPAGSAQVEMSFQDYFDGLGLTHNQVAIGSRSDHAGFLASGIPAGGLFTGAESPKSPAEFALFGGTEGAPLDACYHRACDTIANVDWTVIEEMSDAVVHVTLGYLHDPVFGLAALRAQPVGGSAASVEAADSAAGALGGPLLVADENWGCHGHGPFHSHDEDF